MNIQQNQSQSTQSIQQQTAYNCATIDSSQLQQNSVIASAQKFDQTQYINSNQQQQQQQFSHKINHLINQQSTSSTSETGASTSNYQQSSASPVNNMHLRNHVNKQELTQQPSLPQQKTAPRNNEYLEQQQQQSK